jgi:hypothetical protein
VLVESEEPPTLSCVLGPDRVSRVSRVGGVSIVGRVIRISVISRASVS